MTDTFDTTPANWQGVDDEPTPNSRNLVESGGVYNKLKYIEMSYGKWASAFIDENGNIAIGLNKNGKLFFDEDFTQFLSKLNNVDFYKWLTESLLIKDIFGVVDNNQNAALFADNKGAHFANVVSEDALGRFAIVDKKGYIGFLLDKKGGIHGKYAINVTISYGGKNYQSVNSTVEIPNKDIPYNTAQLVLPSNIPYVVGQIMDIYYEPILKNGFVKDFRIWGSLKYQGLMDRRPISYDSTGNKYIGIHLENSFGTEISLKVSNVVSVDKTLALSYKVCVIGDSKSENATKQAEVLNLISKDGNASLTFIGSHQLAGYDSDDNERTFNNCAASGSGLSDWCCRETVGVINNPFYDANVNSGVYITQTTSIGTLTDAEIKFSVAKFIQTIGDVDIIWIDHGANQPINNETKKCYDYIIDDIKAYNQANNTNIKVVISIQEGTCLVPYYDGVMTNIRQKEVEKQEWYLSNYDGRESEGVYICPQYLNVDIWNDYPTSLVYENTRNHNVTKKICLDAVHMGVNTGRYSSGTTYAVGATCSIGTGLTRNRNLFISLMSNTGVEPNDDKVHWAKADESLNSGYYKIADMYYATLRYIRFKNN
jgi:hypothetical protein